VVPVQALELPEQIELDQLCALAGAALERSPLGEVHHAGRSFKLESFALGNPHSDLPAVAFVGGVHGLERIGAEVVIAYLRSLVMRLRWDDTLHRQLERVRLVFMPLVNPGGIWRGTRANPQGVDLMRNAPVDAGQRAPYLIGGQRLSAKLPWYRGVEGAPMQAESAALCALIERELLGRPFSMAVDCHSGFGLIDRIWFPFAHTAKPIAHLAELHRLSEMLDQSLPNHTYVMEPQSRQYLAHGDIWDHLYLQSQAHPSAVFLPLTLEMGSWVWVKKNPRQLFKRGGIFNPLIEHRQQRVLRRHMSWLDFISRAASSHARWLPQGTARERQQELALAHWYRKVAA